MITCLCNTHEDSGTALVCIMNHGGTALVCMVGLHWPAWWDCIGLHGGTALVCMVGLHLSAWWDCIGLHYQSCWDCNGIAMGLNLSGITMRSDSVGLPKESRGRKYNSK